MLNAPNSFSISDSYAWNSTLSYTGSTADKAWSWLVNYTFAKNKSVSTRFEDANDPYQSYYAIKYPFSYGNSVDIVDMDQIQAQLTYDHRLFSLTGGFDYMVYDGRSGTKDEVEPSFKHKDVAGYLMGKLRLLDGKLIFTAGGRWDAFKLTNFEDDGYSEKNFAPSFGIAYSPVDFLKLRAQYSEGFSVPNYFQLFGGYGGWYVPNLDLKPQQNKTIEFGADVEVANITGSVTYFISQFKNKFVTVQTGPFQSQYRNLGSTTLAGLEMYLSYDIGKALGQEFSLSPYVNLTWMTEAKNKDTVNYVPQAPNELPNIPDLLVSYGISFEYPSVHLSARLNANYFGKEWRQDWEDPTYLATGGDPPWERTGGFTVVDLSVSKRILDFEDKGYLQLDAKVGNVLDTAKAYNPVVVIPGRNFFLSLSYNY
ncbi:MAG: TonB-dependent receptor [Deltaproteobacteria bacterium]|nr:TonB-dependent receptor [Deltaproteobacteria bacterium]